MAMSCSLRADLLSIAHRRKSSEARANQRSAIFHSGSSVTASVCTRSRKHTNAGVHAHPIASASYEDFSVVAFIEISRAGQNCAHVGIPSSCLEEFQSISMVSGLCGLGQFELATHHERPAMRPTRTARLSCQGRRIFQSFRRIVRPEVHCPASRPWRPTKSMNVFVTTRAFGVYGHSQRPNPRSAAPRPLRQHVDTALKGVAIAYP